MQKKAVALAAAVMIASGAWAQVSSNTGIVQTAGGDAGSDLLVPGSLSVEGNAVFSGEVNALAVGVEAALVVGGPASPNASITPDQIDLFDGVNPAPKVTLATGGLTALEGTVNVKKVTAGSNGMVSAGKITGQNGIEVLHGGIINAGVLTNGGNASLGGTATVTGKTTLNGGASVQGGLTTDTLNVTGSLTLGGATLQASDQGNMMSLGIASPDDGHLRGLTTNTTRTVLSGGTRSAVLTLRDGDKTGDGLPDGASLTISGSATGSVTSTALQVTSAADGSNLQTVLGTTAAASTATVQAGNHSIEVGDSGTAVTGNFTATSNAYLGGAGDAASLQVTPSSVTVQEDTSVSMGGNRVQNVGNAVAGSDAVNLNQLNAVSHNLQTQISEQRREARRGIAGAAALAGLPALEAGRQYNFGVGLGHYKCESALSFGGHARINPGTIARFGVGITGGDAAVSAGIGWSF